MQSAVVETYSQLKPSGFVVSTQQSGISYGRQYGSTCCLLAAWIVWKLMYKSYLSHARLYAAYISSNNLQTLSKSFLHTCMMVNTHKF